MNIALFYHKMSRYYFKKALASLLLGVLLSLLIPGLHILFYLLLIILGMTFVMMYVLYNLEVHRSQEALKVTTTNKNQNLVINKDKSSYCFFSLDGIMKSRVYFKEKSLVLENADRESALKVERSLLEMSVQGNSSNDFNGRNASGHRAFFMKRGEGWDLYIDGEKVCSLTRGRLPLQTQQIFDPSSIVVLFEEGENVLKQWALLYIVLLLEDYYVI